MTRPPHHGVLYPARLPVFTRIPAPAAVKDLVTHFWIPEWNIEPGRVSRQYVIAYPALNLVVEGDHCDLHGASTAASSRDLQGVGWAVGALLRPAAIPAFTDNPAELLDAERPVDAPDLVDAVQTVMAGRRPDRQERAVALMSEWLARRVGPTSSEAHLANTLSTLIENDSTIIRLADLAERLHVSERTVRRLTAKYVGLAPGTMIRRRRLQEAVAQLRHEPRHELARLAAELGYADQAHLAREFRAVFGLTPSSYRRRTTRDLTNAHRVDRR